MKTRDFHLPGRSPVFAREGMAATSHPLASLAAIETLKAGGTAADAAVAAVAVLCVVEPAMTGIGGDCFCLVAKPDAPVWGYNGSGRAGAAVTTEKLLALGTAAQNPRDLAACRHGAGRDRGLGRDPQGARPLRPRPRAAARDPLRRERLSDRAARRLRLGGCGRQAASPMPGSAKYYLVDGAAPAIGSVMRLPALAATLKAIAAGGANAFYEGAIAADIAATVQAKGGLLAAEDLARHKGEVVTPISTNYRGLDVVETAAERAGADRAGAAQHPRAVRSRQARSARDRSGCISRSKPRGSPSGCATRTSPIPPHARAGRGPARQGLRQEAFARCSIPTQARAAAEGADARQRHDLSHGGRPRPHGGVADQFALQRVRHRHLHREDRHHAAQSRHRLRGRAGASERRSQPASGRCTRSSRRSRCATDAARCRSA